MTQEYKSELQRITTLGGFHSKIAQSVLASEKMSEKQQNILNEVSEIMLNWLDMDDIDIDNLKHDAKFEEIQIRQIQNQKTAL